MLLGKWQTRKPVFRPRWEPSFAQDLRHGINSCGAGAFPESEQLATMALPAAQADVAR